MIKLLSIADIISLLNIIFGFLSISMIYIGEIFISFSLILLALIADGLDGILARIIGSSDLGEYLDSISDMVSMGVATSIFVFITYYNIVSDNIYQYIVLYFVLIIYLSFGVIRLASFNKMKNKKYFIGLPSPASTIIILVLSFIKINVYYIFIIIFIVSILMISNIQFPKPSLKLNCIAFLLIILTIIFGTSYNNIIPFLLLLSILIYMIAGPIYFLKYQK